MENFAYYAIALVMIILAVMICKKIAGCFIKSVVTLILVATLTALYYIFFHHTGA